MSDTAVSLLLDPENYCPDTLDLLEDKEAREYWLNCFEKLVDKYVTYALLDHDDETVEVRAKQYKDCYLEAIEELKGNPSAHGPLTIRLLLDLNQTCLRSQGFVDLWKLQKKQENEAALTKLRQRLEEVDLIEDDEDKWIELCSGMLAGNLFDWGAQAVSDILENNSKFGLKEALDKIQKRPWLIDGLNKWLERLKGPTHKNALIFVDNSGVDIILGVLPLARQLLLRGTRVTLCANERPALNDITYPELVSVVQSAATECAILSSALDKGMLAVVSNGQPGPCLDLRSLSLELKALISSHPVDLVIIEGMGRSLHTNLRARLACDCLKLAVLKNQWLADRMGGHLFSVLCLFEEYQSQYENNVEKQ